MQKIWNTEGVGAYRTMMVKNIPNFFLIGGPNTATGHASVIMAAEHGIDYYMKVAKPVIQGKEKSVECKPEAYDSWFKLIQDQLAKSVFGTAFGGCASWYRSDQSSQIHYWYITHFPNYRELTYKHNNKKTA